MNLPIMSREEARELLQGLKEEYRGLSPAYRTAVKQEIGTLSVGRVYCESCPASGASNRRES